jgi:hypothetical protein
MFNMLNLHYNVGDNTYAVLIAGADNVSCKNRGAFKNDVEDVWTTLTSKYPLVMGIR